MIFINIPEKNQDSYYENLENIKKSWNYAVPCKGYL